MSRSSVDLMSEIVDLVDGLVFDDLGSESARPLHALLLLPGQTLEGFEPRHDQIGAVLEELVTTNGADSNAPALVAFLSSLGDLQLWVADAGVARAVWLIAQVGDGGRVGVRTAVIWS